MGPIPSFRSSYRGSVGDSRSLSGAGQSSNSSRALVGCLLVLEWARRSNTLRLDARARAVWDGACSAPGWAVLAAALVGTVVANYPVIFAGRSLVTPGLVGSLLYGQPPFLPGVHGSDLGGTGDAHGADVGALLWYHLPASVAESRAVLRDGELPLWDRYNSAGSSLMGQGQSCFGDPLQILPLLAGGAAWSWDLKFLLAKWLFACGIGLCVWRTSRHLPSALALAVSASFIGLFVYRLNHPAIFSACYSPWILYCWLRFSGSTSARSGILWLVALIGANWTEMNSGTVKEAYVLLISINFTGLCILLASQRPFREKMSEALLAGRRSPQAAVFAMSWAHLSGSSSTGRSRRRTPAMQRPARRSSCSPGMFLGLFDEAFYRPFQEHLGVVNPSANFFVLIGLAWIVVRWRAVMADRVAVGELFLSSASRPSLWSFGVDSRQSH